MYYTIESSNAWGVTCFRTANDTWSFKRADAQRFNTLLEAQTAFKSGKLANLGRIEAYKGD